MGVRGQRSDPETDSRYCSLTNQLIVDKLRPVVLVAIALLSLLVGCGGSSNSTTKPQPPATGRANINWRDQRFPIRCGKGVELRVLQVKSLSPAPSERRTAVLVQCPLEDGTGDAELLTYTTPSSHPKLAQQLIHQGDALFPTSLLRVGSQNLISMKVFAFSSINAPRCCPDMKAVLSWRWIAGKFRLATKVPRHATGF
jgi:hypothetical protein